MIRFNDSARALLAVAATFVMGIVVGCGLDRNILSPPSYAASGAAQHDVARHHEQVLAELRTELRLSPDQAARVQQIFAARQAEVDTAWAQVHANLQRAMQQTTTEIETVLDSTQIERLHTWIAKRHGPRHGDAARHH